MRIDVVPIIEQAVRLAAAIADKSKSRASQEAHTLLTIMPSPCWTETAPGCSITYGHEIDMAISIHKLHYSALSWLKALMSDHDWEPSAEWPQPDNLIEATRELAKYTSDPIPSADLETV